MLQAFLNVKKFEIPKKIFTFPSKSYKNVHQIFFPKPLTAQELISWQKANSEVIQREKFCFWVLIRQI
ncbi:MAG: hypothetical protein EAZ97_13395 [Bacteroidetes bacterium]|nr:MAG: hypothetical protein EAZ97_13395 [Bacteroidota bacterium]